MEKIQYGDVNRFLVSIGLVLISLSLIIPFLYLREDFGLYIESRTLETYSSTTKDLIHQKEQIISAILKKMYILSITLFLGGTATLTWGLIRWFKRQRKFDERDDLTNIRLKLEIESLTTEEKRELVKEDIYSNELAELAEQSIEPKEKEEAINDYLKAEEKVIELFRNYSSKNFEVLDNVRIAGRYAVDILLEAKDKGFLDRIIEVKYSNKIIAESSLTKSIDQLSRYIDFYSRFYNKPAIPVLLIIYSNNAEVTEDNIKELKGKINLLLDRSNSRSIKRLRVYFIKESEIKNFDIKQVLLKNTKE